MSKKRNVGQEILKGIKEITAWQRGKKQLKITKIKLPKANHKAFNLRMELSQASPPG